MLDRDMEIWDRDAAYYYYLHGPLKRIELGEDKIQGIDFLYTINGWLKSVNIEDNHNNPEYGVSGATPGDAYGYTLDYYNDGSGDKDFVHNSTDFGNGATLLPTAGAVNHSLYDGNIAAWEEYYGSETSAKMPDPLNFESSRARLFQYDKLNRLKDNTTYNYTAGAWANSPNNSSHYNYDANGNLMNLVRNDNSGVQLDDLNYLYQDFRYSPSGPVYRTNRLSILKDMPGTTASTRDLETPNPVTDFYAYTYDASGNLISDVKDNINHIEWTADGKVSYVEKDMIVSNNSNTVSQPVKISFMYDAFGNRVGKDVMIHEVNNVVAPFVADPTESLNLLLDQVGVGSTYYMLDANGQVLAIYESKKTVPEKLYLYASDGNDVLLFPDRHVLSEWDIYGSAAHGKFAIRQPKEELVYTESEIPRGSAFYRIVGEKQYHLTDHLGNVRATVSDIKEPSGGGFLTNTITAASFYPFGFMEEGRFFFSGSNRWGFGGHEKDDEVRGTGNRLSFGDYGYDPRKAMRQNIEPLIGKYPGFSSYLAFGDNPIVFADPMGLDATHYTLKKNEDGSFEKIEGETVDELNGQELEGNYSIYHYNGNTYTFSDRNPEDDNLWIWSWNIEKEDDFASNPDAAIEIGVKPDQYYYDKFDFWKRVGEVSGLDDPIRLAIDGYFMGKVGKASVGAFKPKKIISKIEASNPSIDLQIGRTVSIQKMKTHKHLEMNVPTNTIVTKGTMHSIEDAQRVLNAYHSGTATVLKVVNKNEIVVKYEKVSGTFRVKDGTISGESNIFTIKGKKTVTVHPENPRQYGY